ncbi:MAG: hypothetical protein J7K00_00200 [Candidatus Diapherotrites archaeon]|nr:hypothetical protein [Candidatus Diapherotrites archaeon]
MKTKNASNKTHIVIALLLVGLVALSGFNTFLTPDTGYSHAIENAGAAGIILSLVWFSFVFFS